MIAEGPLVKGWAVSTAPKIVQLLDEFVINYPQANVRKTTAKLLTSLFKKGTEQQRANIMKLLIERLKNLNQMGKSSQQFLLLISNIFELFPNDFNDQKMLIFNFVLEKVKQIFGKVTENKDYTFYSLCSNMIDFGDQFKPYLLEANGCLKCFGRPDVSFEQMNINSIRSELKVHINNIQWVLKRKYEMNNLNINFMKKKINFKSMIIYYLDDHGSKVELGKYTPNDNIPPFNITTNALGITFQFHKIRRNHIACMLCSANQEYAVLCSNCVGKLIEIDGSVKVVSGNASKINKELIESFKILNQLKSQLAQFAKSVGNESKISHLKLKIVSQMESCYSGIIQNIRLLRNLNETELKGQRQKYGQFTTDCYSCHFFELSSCISFVSSIIKKTSFKLEPQQLNELIALFKNIFTKNKVHSLDSLISSILSELFNRVTNIIFMKQIDNDKISSKLYSKLIINFISHIKLEHKENIHLLNDLKKQIFNQNVNKTFTIHEKVQLFVNIVLNQQYFELLNVDKFDAQKLKQIKRLQKSQYQEYNNLLNFQISQILQLKIQNIFKIFLSIIPQQYVPISNLNIVDSGYLKYIVNKPPIITDQLILSNIVYTPNPIIKLNLFKLLPEIIQNLSLQDGVELIRQLCKYKSIWNTYIRQTVQNFNKMLDSVEKQRKLMLCLQGYHSSKEDLYFDHIYKILTPQRPNFIIRLQIPEKQMLKEQKNKGGPVEYIYLPIRQVKSDDLKSDTIGALHEWITQQIKKIGQDMPFDLIVQGYIIDQLDLSLQIIYKKYVQKQTKRSIGNKTYDFFKVIYRIQGIFGQANQRNCGHPRDQKREQCTQFSSNLLNKLPNKKTGLNVLMQMIPSLDFKTVEGKEKKSKILKILEIMFKNQTMIQKIVQFDHANIILNLATQSISLNKKQIKQTQVLLGMCSMIIDQANQQMVKIRKNSGVYEGRKASEADMDIQVDSEESLRSVKYVLEKVKQAQQGGFRQLSKKLIKILPFCSKDDMTASRYLYQFFQVNKILQIKFLSKLSWFLQFINALSESYSSFKQICREEGITSKIIDQVFMGLSNTQPSVVKQNLQNIQTSLAVLKGLAQGDLNLQEQLFKRQIFQLIYQVQGDKKIQIGKIPSYSYNFIKYFQQGKIILPQVHQFFVSMEKKKKQSVESNKKRKRQEVLKKKNASLASFQHLLSQKIEALSCSSCKQGYPGGKGVLGVYLYSTKNEVYSIDGWWKESKKLQAFTSTSYFLPIHLECHIKAMKVDQKSQWDGALIRNSEVLCNNWCPIKGPETTDQDYDKAVKKYFQKNNKNVSFWVVINDLNGLLERFSREYNFAHETKGSSPTHNAKLIPVLIQLACHLLRNNEEQDINQHSIKFVKEGVAFIEEHMTKKSSLIHLYFCLLLFVTPNSHFKTKKQFCLSLIDNFECQSFKEKKPLYIELAMIESIMKITHGIDGENIPNQLDQFINKNLTNVLQSFEVLAESYKNIYLHWQKIEQVKEYFQQ